MDREVPRSDSRFLVSRSGPRCRRIWRREGAVVYGSIWCDLVGDRRQNSRPDKAEGNAMVF